MSSVRSQKVYITIVPAAPSSGQFSVPCPYLNFFWNKGFLRKKSWSFRILSQNFLLCYFRWVTLKKPNFFALRKIWNWRQFVGLVPISLILKPIDRKFSQLHFDIKYAEISFNITIRGSFSQKWGPKNSFCPYFFNHAEFRNSEARFVISIKNYTIYVTFSKIWDKKGELPKLAWPLQKADLILHILYWVKRVNQGTP